MLKPTPARLWLLVVDDEILVMNVEPVPLSAPRGLS
jgi:hypothetical protein